MDIFHVEPHSTLIIWKLKYTINQIIEILGSMTKLIERVEFQQLLIISCTPVHVLL